MRRIAQFALWALITTFALGFVLGAYGYSLAVGK